MALARFLRNALGLAETDDEVTHSHQRTTVARIWRAVVAEFMASALFTYFAVVAWSAAQSRLFVRTSAEPLLIGLAEGMLLVALIFSFAKVSGGQVNPAVTVGFMAQGSMPWLRGVLYILAQIAGSMLGAIGARGSIPSLEFRQEGVPQPMNGEPVMKAFVAETMFTFVWVHTILIYKDPEVKAERIHWMRSLTVGLAVAAGVMIAQPFTGGSLSPARAFGAALVADNWRFQWLYWAAPLLGALIAGLLVRLLWQTRPPLPSDKRSPGLPHRG